MAEVLLDTNFIIACINQKIDFFEQLQFMGFSIVIPQQVLDEIVKLKREFEAVVLKEYRDNYKVIRFKKGYVDKGIIEYAKKNPRTVIATLDRDLKKQLANPIIVVRRKKKLEII